jgi:ORF6N domain
MPRTRAPSPARHFENRSIAGSFDRQLSSNLTFPDPLQLSLLSCFEIFIYYPPIRFGGFPLKQSSLIPVERIKKAIYSIRGHKVMLDRDLTHLYGVSTRVLKQAVRRNLDRFPDDFMFVLNPAEFQDWRSQFVTSKAEGRHRMLVQSSLTRRVLPVPFDPGLESPG